MATFFIVGERANASPELVRRAYEEGHTVGTHSQTHANLAELPLAAPEKEISDGFDSTNTALGGQRAAAPFFRGPYLATTPGVEQYLSEHGVMLWSIDVDPRTGGLFRRTKSSNGFLRNLRENIPASC